MDTTGADKVGAAPQECEDTAMRHDVFISCTPEDQALVETISTRLKQRKLTSWYPLRDIVGGMDEQEQIDAAIKASKAVVLAFTDAANASAEVLREMSVAIDEDVEIVPFKLTSTLPVMGLEYYLSTLPWVDGTTEPIDESARGLAATVAELLGKTADSNKLTDLWQRAKNSDGSEDISDMGVPVTIVIPEQGSWETEAPASGTQELAMATDGVPVTIVYPEAGTWELREEEAEDGATAESAQDAQAAEVAAREPADGSAEAAGGNMAEGAGEATEGETAGERPGANEAAAADGTTNVANGAAGESDGNAAEGAGPVAADGTTNGANRAAGESDGSSAEGEAVTANERPGANEAAAADGTTNGANGAAGESDGNAAEGEAATANERPGANEAAAADGAATTNGADGDGDASLSNDAAEERSPEEELLAVSIEAAKQLHQMTKRDEGGPAPIGDIIKVAIALILAVGTLLYLLITSIR